MTTSILVAGTATPLKAKVAIDVQMLSHIRAIARVCVRRARHDISTSASLFPLLPSLRGHDSRLGLCNLVSLVLAKQNGNANDFASGTPKQGGLCEYVVLLASPFPKKTLAKRRIMPLSSLRFRPLPPDLCDLADCPHWHRT